MNYYSTRSGQKIQADFCGAMATALAPDGGLYVPAGFPRYTGDTKDYALLTANILSLFTDISRERLADEVEENYRDFPIPIVPTPSGTFLELFHGPSGAFKDVALTLLPRLASLCGITDTTYVTATSGDTGKAAMEALKDRPDARIMVFYPKEGVARLQEQQMITQEGDNVRVVAIDGDFDDAQRAVKEILAAKHRRVSSCNSINIARLLSQIPYYFYAGNHLPGDAEATFFVPCGNFGNILAGWYAKQMGLPVKKLVVCTNENTVLRDFFATGVYDRRRELIRTISPSMDILVSSNLERLLYHLMGPEETALRMDQLALEGIFTVPPEILSDFSAYGATTAEVEEVTRQVWEEGGYLMDPHTACARVAWEKMDRPDHSILLATASPSKFPESMIRILEGKTYDSRESLERLEQYEALHPAIRGVLDRPVRFTETIQVPDALQVFNEFQGE